MRHRLLTVGTAGATLVLVLVFITPHVRREFFPETDAGAFEIYVRANTGTRLTETEKRVADVEQLVKQTVGDDLDLIVSEMGVWADWSAAYTPNSGPMDAVVKVQLTDERSLSAQEYAIKLRHLLRDEPRLADLHVILVQDTKGMVDAEYQREKFPATWARMHHKGRVFYTSMGHRDDVWKSATFQKVLLGGIWWSLGLVKADITPNLKDVCPKAGELPATK